MEWNNLHEVLRSLYDDMMPLAGDMVAVAKGLAGLDALFYVALKVWQALSRAEPIDMFPLLRPFALGLCIMCFPTVVLGTINAVLSPVVTGTHAIFEDQVLDLSKLQQQKDQEKRNALTTLSDYWSTDSTLQSEKGMPEQSENNGMGSGNSTLNSYRNAQRTLGSFYQDNNSETQELRKQIDELKNRLADKDVPKSTTIDRQLKLMEKSYEMAAKYLPANSSIPETVPTKAVTPTPTASKQKEHFVAFTPSKKNIVSALYREPTDSAFLEDWSQNKNRGFYTAGAEKQVVQPKNSIKACMYDAQTVIGETGVRLRLLEPAKTPNHTIPKGTVVTANAKFQNGRLQLKITSVELEGNIIPVDISIYDLDGQQGLNVPYSPESNTLTDIVANMGNATGSSFSMSSTTGQQITSDLSKSAVQGISGYFAKKVRTPKVTLKAGHQVFLVSKQ